jgi:hypothetical protein
MVEVAAGIASDLAADVANRAPTGREMLRLLSSALQNGGVTLALTSWVPFTTPLTFAADVQLRLYRRLEGFPLNATWSLVPCRAADRALAEETRYRPDAVWSARCEARIARRHGHAHPLDMREADWEMGYRRNRASIRTQRLGANSFIGFDRVGHEGRIHAGSRPVLGHRRDRDSIRPTILIGARGVADDEMAEVIASADIAIIDIQDLRAPTALRACTLVLAKRPHSGATLVLAQSPCEALRLFGDAQRWPRCVLEGGRAPALSDIGVSALARDRIQGEVEFEAAVTPLESLSPLLQPAIRQARRAWWEANQLVAPLQARPAFDAFKRELETLGRMAAHDARHFTSARRLIDDAATGKHIAERFEACLDSIRTLVKEKSGVLVLARSTSSSIALSEAVAQRLGCSTLDLKRQGIRFASAYPSGVRGGQEKSVLLTGFFGQHSLDAIFATNAVRAQLLLDPVESRDAFTLLERQLAFVQGTQAVGIAASLALARQAIRPNVIPQSETVSVGFQTQGTLEADNALLDGERIRIRDVGEPEDDASAVLIVLGDGTILDVASERRFDVLDHDRRSIRKVAAHELQPGDEVVVVQGDYRRTLSELLLEALDTGPLKQLAIRRQTWLALVNAAAQHKSLGVIAREMAALGFPVDRPTIAQWVMRNDDAFAEMAAPGSGEVFRAFAQALQVPLPERDIDAWYQDIQKLRVVHRTAGMNLARAMCAAALGRLDTRTLAKMRQDWGGLDISDLIEGTHLATVEDVRLPFGHA